MMLKLFSRKKKVVEQEKKTFNKQFIIGMATLATTSALAVPTFAAEGAGTVDSGVTTVVTVFGQVWTLITGNPVLLAFVGASLLGVGVGVFKKLKGSVK